MEQIIIYDNTGKIFSRLEGHSLAPIGLPHMIIDVANNKMVSEIDTSALPHKPIFVDIPKTKEELLNEKIQLQEEAIVELANILAEVLG